MHFSWDFLRIRETGQAVIWSSFAIGKVIDEARYTTATEYKGKNLAALWREIFDHSRVFSADATQ
jgi:hypothetical protein